MDSVTFQRRLTDYWQERFRVANFCYPDDEAGDHQRRVAVLAVEREQLAILAYTVAASVGGPALHRLALRLDQPCDIWGDDPASAVWEDALVELRTPHLHVSIDQAVQLMRAEVERRTADAPPSIPPERRTKPMSQAEAGCRIGLQPDHGKPAARREAAGKAARRLMENGGLRWEACGTKYVFDKTQVPDE